MEMKTKLLITGLAFMAMTILVSAQNQEAPQRQQNPTGRGSAWVDANNDGVCDNFETNKSSGLRGNRSGNFKSTDQCPGLGMGQRGMRQGQGKGQGMGQGNNRNFVDADKNGICDFRETPAKK
jgi:hypothetical protein